MEASSGVSRRQVDRARAGDVAGFRPRLQTYDSRLAESNLRSNLGPGCGLRLGEGKERGRGPPVRKCKIYEIEHVTVLRRD